jgi:hypothetical protein
VHLQGIGPERLIPEGIETKYCFTAGDLGRLPALGERRIRFGRRSMKGGRPKLAIRSTKSLDDMEVCGRSQDPHVAILQIGNALSEFAVQNKRDGISTGLQHYLAPPSNPTKPSQAEIEARPNLGSWCRLGCEGTADNIVHPSQSRRASLRGP